MPEEASARELERRRRLAEALRENLRRRKAQARERVAQDTPPADRQPGSPADPEVL